MNLNHLEVGDRVEVYRRPGQWKTGPKIGQCGTVIRKLFEHKILVKFDGFGSWYIWQCDGKYSVHHCDQECSCMLRRPYIWRKL